MSGLSSPSGAGLLETLRRKVLEGREELARLQEHVAGSSRRIKVGRLVMTEIFCVGNIREK